MANLISTTQCCYIWDVVSQGGSVWASVLTPCVTTLRNTLSNLTDQPINSEDSRSKFEGTTSNVFS